MKKLLIVMILAAVGAVLLKKQRERELDEAIWEEPRNL